MSRRLNSLRGLVLSFAFAEPVLAQDSSGLLTRPAVDRVEAVVNQSLDFEAFSAQNPGLNLEKLGLTDPGQFEFRVSNDDVKIIVYANGREVAEIDKEIIRTMKSPDGQDFIDRSDDAWV